MGLVLPRDGKTSGGSCTYGGLLGELVEVIQESGLLQNAETSASLR